MTTSENPAIATATTPPPSPPPAPPHNAPVVTPEAQTLLAQERETHQTGGTIQVGNTIYAKSEIANNSVDQLESAAPGTNVSRAELSTFQETVKAGNAIEENFKKY